VDALPATPAGSRPGLRLPAALLLLVLGLLLNLPRLAGPFTDGQAGNCGAMFAIFARNEAALGLSATRGVPVVNPVPPVAAAAAPGAAEVYAHHPPGLPWLVMLASHLPVAIETAGRLVALLAFLAATLLLADLAARLAGPGAALSAGLLMLLLPAGRHDATLVNYETVALPALLLLLRALRLGVGRAWLAAVLAALMDWIALLPLLFGPGAAGGRAWRRALLAAAVVAGGWLLLARSVAPEAAGGTLAQGVAATFLAREFSAGAWVAALGGHVAALYGWALLPAAVSLLALPRQASATRGLLLRLLAVGALNVIVFAQHATGHEHFSLLLLPWVALSVAVLLFPGTPAGGPPRALALGVIAAVLVAGTWQAQRQMPERTSTAQAALADGLRAVAPEQGVYVRPGGAPFVFLHRALRHVVPTGAGSLEQARALAEQYRQRFGLPADWPACAALAPGEPAPAWLAAQPGAGEAPDGWRCVPLGP
jgi:Dolichyl-phosphate-mannose-protein mannosyltransferase